MYWGPALLVCNGVMCNGVRLCLFAFIIGNGVTGSGNGNGVRLASLHSLWFVSLEFPQNI